MRSQSMSDVVPEYLGYKKVVETALHKRDSVCAKKDDQGGNRKCKQKERDEPREHIKMFPTKHSHYCGKNTNEMFLHERLTTEIMYKLYVTWCKEMG